MNKEFLKIIKKALIIIAIVFLLGIISRDKAMWLGYTVGGITAVIQAFMMYFDLEKMLTFKISSKKYAFASYTKRYVVSILVMIIMIKIDTRHFAFCILGLLVIKIIFLLSTFIYNIKKGLKTFYEKYNMEGRGK